MIHFYKCNHVEDLNNCAQLIDRGGIVIFPTDTVYGIGCDPTNETAVNRLFHIKKREYSKYLPVLTNSVEHVLQFAYISLHAKLLIKNFWPGKITLVLKYKKNSKNLISKKVYNSINNTIAFRIPDSSCMLELIKKTKTHLLTGTSANLSGRLPIISIDQVRSSGLKGYDGVLDGGMMLNASNISSTIVDLSDETNVKILREGEISSKKIFNILQTTNINNIHEI